MRPVKIVLIMLVAALSPFCGAAMAGSARRHPDSGERPATLRGADHGVLMGLWRSVLTVI